LHKLYKSIFKGVNIMGQLFGTDGVRGIADSNLIKLTYKLGQAGAYVLTSELKHTPKILIGMDTRVSGKVLETAY
jgi:phosphoglucosamine mutase